MRTEHDLRVVNLHTITEWLGLAGTSGGHLAQPLRKQGHPELVAWLHVQVAFEYVQGEKLVDCTQPHSEKISLISSTGKGSLHFHFCK